jgi:hypothetical protein
MEIVLATRAMNEKGKLWLGGSFLPFSALKLNFWDEDKKWVAMGEFACMEQKNRTILA